MIGINISLFDLQLSILCTVNIGAKNFIIITLKPRRTAIVLTELQNHKAYNFHQKAN